VPSAGSHWWWPTPTSSVSPSSSSCPAACPIYFHSSPWTDLFCRPFSHTHAHHYPPWHTTPRFDLFVSFQTSPRPHRVISRKKTPAFHFVLPSLARAKLLLLVSIWYGCSLHFFGSFVIDRATGCLTILQQKEKSGFQKQEGITTGRDQRKNPSPNRIATLNPTAFTGK